MTAGSQVAGAAVAKVQNGTPGGLLVYVEELIPVSGLVGVVDVLFVWFVVGIVGAVLMLPW